LKNLNVSQCLRLYSRLFDCHVLGRPPCHKSGSPIKIFTRAVFFVLGFFNALGSLIQSLWNDGQIYTRLDKESIVISQESLVINQKQLTTDN
jgi:hypothetical protein